ncbi:hypothetical protein ACVIGB_000052 [Bradyrhizobium sp. USDA 4341]
MIGLEHAIMTPACGTSVSPRRRPQAPERIHSALADMEHLMSAFEVGAPEAPAPGLENNRPFSNEPSWAPPAPRM